MSAIMSSSPSDSQVTMARSLASPIKETRDKTIAALRSFLSNMKDTLPDIEMMKLWKALHYCFWLSDKTDIQLELAENLSSLINYTNSVSMTILYLSAFYRTIIREWHYLDQHRVNKFYSLLRIMLRSIFTYLQTNKWEKELTKTVLNVLDGEILKKTPNGLRYHMADIYLPELYRVTEGNISHNVFVMCIQPFLNALGSTNEARFHERICGRIISNFLSSYSIESETQKIIDSDDEEVNKSDIILTLFKKVKTSQIQAQIFSIASDENTIEQNRRKCYNVHKEFHFYTGIQYAELIDIEDEVHVDIIDKSDKKKNKKTKKEDRIIEETPVIVEKKDKKRKKIEQEEEIQEVNVKLVKKDKSKSKKVEENIIEKEEKTIPLVESDKKKKKKKNQEEQIEAPIVAPITPAKTELPKKQEDFIKSPKFTGSKPGYMFKKDKKGLGYYIDQVQLKKMKTAEKKKKNQNNSEDKKSVRFGTPHSKGYNDSVLSLKTSTPDLKSTPKKSAISIGSSSSKRPKASSYF
jgi:ribosomal RNA-processing protein 1